jgi:hypothetical protein
MSDLTKEQILAAEDVKREKVPVKELGGDLYVQELDCATHDAMDARIIDARKASGGNLGVTAWRALVLSFCVVDANGGQMFSESELLALAKRKGQKPFMRLYRVAHRLNELGGDAEDEAEKNSASGPDKSSSTASPSV